MKKMTCAMAVSMGAVLGANGGAMAAKPELPPVPDAVLEVVKDAPLIRYGRTIKGGAHTNGAWSEGWQVAAAVAAWQGNTAADAKLLEQIEYNLVGENGFSANGGYPAQHEMTMTATYAILKQSDRFWNGVLTEEQRKKIDLLMKATMVASAYTTADATYAGDGPHTALDGDRNLNRHWNPNFREGMYGNLITGMVYFGVDAAKSILSSYDHDKFVAELEAAELTNTHGTFTWAASNPESGAPDGERIEQHVRNYTYDKEPLKGPFEMYAWLTRNTYNRPVSAGLNDGAGIMEGDVPTGVIAKGKENLPNAGELGMLTEFESVDAKGKRGSITYAIGGFRPNLASHAVVVVGGYWQDGEVAEELVRRKDVGVTDLVYKLEHGFRNYQHGKGSLDVFSINKEHWNISFRTTIPLWTEVFRKYHQTGSATAGN